MKQETFKQTGIGKIPKEWEVVRISQIGKVITGTTPSTKVEEYWGGNYPFVTPTDFSTSKYVYKTERSVTKKGANKGKIIPKDSVMVTCIASVGEVALASSECITNQQINSIICNQNANPHYIYYALFFRKNLLKGWAGVTTTPIIKKSLFEKFPIPLPPLPEQQKIAEILSTVDSAIEKVNQAIEKTQRLKKGLMQKLLTKGIGHNEFKDTEIGRIPKEWEVVRLGEVGNIRYGLSQPPEITPYGIPMIRATNIKRGKIVEDGILRVNPKTIPKSKNPYLKKGDIIVVRSGAYTGDIGLVTTEWVGAIVGYDLIITPKKEKIKPKFLAYYLLSSSVQIYFSTQKERSAQPHLNSKELSRTLIFLPPLPEQQKIAEILSTVDKRLELLKKKKEKLERIKKGLMNDLLTGRRRVKV